MAGPESIPSLAKSIPRNRFLGFLNGGRSTNTSSERECVSLPPLTPKHSIPPPALPSQVSWVMVGVGQESQDRFINFNYRKRFWWGGPHRKIVSTLWLLFVKGHGNEADFLGFLQKLVPHESLTLPFGPPTLRIVDTGSRYPAVQLPLLLCNLYCSLSSLYCSLSSFHCSLCNLYCSLSSLHYSLCNLHCSLSSLHCSLCSPYCSLSSFHCSL